MGRAHVDVAAGLRVAGGGTCRCAHDYSAHLQVPPPATRSPAATSTWARPISLPSYPHRMSIAAPRAYHELQDYEPRHRELQEYSDDVREARAVFHARSVPFLPVRAARAWRQSLRTVVTNPNATAATWHLVSHVLLGINIVLGLCVVGVLFVDKGHRKAFESEITSLVGSLVGLVNYH